MARRRRVKASAPAAKKPAKPAEPEATTAVATVEEMPATLANDLEKVREMFAYKPQGDLVSTESFLVVPTIRFFSGSEGKQGGQLTAALIGQALGNVPVGTPYVLAEGQEVFPIAGTVLVQTAAFQFWQQTDMQNQRTAAWTRNPGREVNGKRVTECVLALQIVLPGRNELHEALQPAQVCLTTYRNATCKAAVTIDKAIQAALTNAWMEKHSHLGGVPDCMRMVATLQGSSKPGKPKPNGEVYRYTIASAVPKPIEPAQMAALAKWWDDEDCQAEYAEGHQAFVDEVASIKAQADAE